MSQVASSNIEMQDAMIPNKGPVGQEELFPKPRLSVFGLGYVGAVSTGCFADMGFQLVGVDANDQKVAMIQRGEAPIFEPGLVELLWNGIRENRVQATTQAYDAVMQSDVSMICVGTPTGESGGVDFKYLDQVCEDVGRAIGDKASYHVVVMRSTIPAGTTEARLLPIIEKASGKKAGEDFGLCFNPEFLREGTAVADFYAPPKTVVGAYDDRSFEVAARLYEGIEGGVIRTTISAAEMVKYVDNTWHAVKVAFANEVGKLCKGMAVDSHEVMNIFVQDLKLNLSPYYLKPGFAFGGSCLPKDVRGITNQAARLGVDTPLMNSLLASNASQIEHARTMIEALEGKRVGFLGITFKADTDDMRESPVLELMAALRRKDYEMVAFDPNLKPGEPFQGLADYLRNSREDLAGMLDLLPSLLRSSAEEVLENCDILVVARNGEEYRKVCDGRKPGQHVLDLVRLDGVDIEEEGYHGICW